MAGKSSPALFELIRDPATVRQPNVRTGPPDAAAPVPATPSPPVARPVPAPAPVVEPPKPAPAERIEPAPLRVEPEISPTPRQVVPTPPTPDPSPVPVVRATPPAAAAVRAAERPSGKIEWKGKRPASILGIAIAGVVISWVLIWAVAYRVGFDRGDDRATRELSLSTTPVTDPLVGDSRPSQLEQPVVRTPSAPTLQTPQQRETRPQSPSTATRTSPPALVSTGVRGVMVPPERDPRQEGLNYYAIEGQLDRDSAQQIVLFLAEQGVASMAIDTSPPGSNNPRSYRVYGLLGLSSAEYRTAARTDYEQQISRLGEIFRRDHRGWTDFSRTTWERYRP